MPEPRIEPCLFVIFGATSDLMHRKLLPALYQLGSEAKLVEQCHILGVSRTSDLDDVAFRAVARKPLQPDEGFDLNFAVKKPGQAITLQTQKLRFRYAEAFAPLADAYETPLLDVLRGGQTLFVRSDWVETSWRIYAPVLENPPQVHFYPAGSWGPSAADQLLQKDGREWFTP